MAASCHSDKKDTEAASLGGMKILKTHKIIVGKKKIPSLSPIISEVSVTYWMKELLEGCILTEEDPDWEYVNKILEGSMPHQIKYNCDG